MGNALASTDSQFPSPCLVHIRVIDGKSLSRERRNGDALRESSGAGFLLSQRLLAALPAGTLNLAHHLIQSCFESRLRCFCIGEQQEDRRQALVSWYGHSRRDSTWAGIINEAISGV